MAKKKSRVKHASKRYQVFLSHATGDKWLARTLCEKIEATGAATFRDDRDIHGGDDIPDEIRRQLKASNEMVVLLTPVSVDSRWVILKIGAAWGPSKRKRVTLVLCHISTDPLPATMKFKKAVTLIEFDAYIEELAARVENHYGNG